MTSRERVRAVLERRPPDRMPVDIGGTNVTGMHPEAYARLKRHLGLGGGAVRVFDVEGLAAEVELPVIAALGGDFLYIKRQIYRYGVPNRDWRPWTLPSGLTVEIAGGYEPRRRAGGTQILVEGSAVADMPDGASGFDPMAPAGPRPRPEDLRFPALTDDDCRYLESTSRNAYEGTGLCLTGEWHGKGLLGAGCLYAGGMESFLCDLLADPSYAHAVLDRYTEHYLAQLPSFFQAVSRRLDVYDFYDDFGTQAGPLVSPEVFRTFFAPRYRRIIDAIKAASGCRIFFHSCGAVRALIPEMIAMGVDCLNPLQPGLPGMEPASLAADFGDRLVFWGGAVNAQTILESGTPEEVRREALANAAALSSRGAYVFAASHNISRKVPPENVVTLFAAARDAPVRPTDRSRAT